MKNFKYLAAPLLLLAILLAGCGKSDVSGTWVAAEAGGIDVGSAANEYVFSEDGTFNYSNDGLALDKGKYEVKGNEIKLNGKDNNYTLKISDDDKTFKYQGKTFEKEDE